MMKVRKYLSVVIVGISLMTLPFVSCDKEDGEKSEAYKAGQTSGEKFCNCLDTVSDPVWGGLECALLISVDAALYTNPSDTTDFANGFADGSATCTE